MRLFAISDQHYGHENIIKYCSRDVLSADEDAIRMIKAHNDVVGDDDLTIFVGDVSCSAYGTEILPKIIPKLKGQKILVRGNHDKQSKNRYLGMGFQSVHDILIIDEYIFCHYPNHPQAVELAKERGLILVCGHTHKPFPDYDDGIERINVAVDVMGVNPKLLKVMS